MSRGRPGPRPEQGPLTATLPKTVPITFDLPATLCMAILADANEEGRGSFTDEIVRRLTRTIE